MKTNRLSILAADFDLDILFQDEEVALLGSVKGPFYHFLYYADSTIQQFYFHRHEWASYLARFKNSPRARLKDQTWFINGSENAAGLVIDGRDLEFPLSSSGVGKQILKDVDTLIKVQAALQQETIKNTLSKKISARFEEKGEEPIQDWELEIVKFESEIQSRKNKIKDCACIDIISFKNAGRIPSKDFNETAETICSTETCECGSADCFFDLLNTTFLDLFHDKAGFMPNGQFSEDVSLAKFLSLMADCSPEQRAVLLFLEKNFGNNVLFNLSFLSRKFDLAYYQYLMTSSYQPDSEDEAFVRRISTLAAYYLRLSENYQQGSTESSNIRLRGYSLKLPKVNESPAETHSFSDEYWLDAREKVVQAARAFKEENFSYRGVKIILHYEEKLPGKTKYVAKKLAILTGKRMHTADIIKALDLEAAVLSAAGYEFPVMKTAMDDEITGETSEYTAVNQFFVTLYYFTV